MTFEIDVAGASRSVVVELVEPGRYRVTVDGQPHEMDAVRIGEYGLSIVDAAGRSRELQIVPAATKGEMLVTVDGRTVPASVDGRRFKRGSAEAGGQAHGVHNIVAPMPGRVVRVLVGVGDEIAVRQPVAVVEAMKMENELRSSKAGRVRDVLVEAGAPVEAGRVLVVVE